jgi:hypothetical protein
MHFHIQHSRSGNLFGATLTGGTGSRCHNYLPYPAGWDSV